MFHVLQDWIIKHNIGDINMVKYLGDEKALGKVSDGFSKISGGILKGSIGVLHGWVVRIVRTSWRDRIYNPVFFQGIFFMLSMFSILLMTINVSFGFHIPTKTDLMTQVVSKTHNCTRGCFRYKTDYIYV